MKNNQKGFSVVEILIVIVVVGLLGGAGWYVWKSKDKNQTPITTNNTVQKTEPEIYKRSTTVPSDWKTYSNQQYKISMSYPQNWTIRAEDNDGELSGWIYVDNGVNSQGMPWYGFYTQSKSLDEAIAEQKRIVNDNQSAESGIKFTITNEKAYIIDGHKAVRIDTTSDDGTAPDSYNTKFYINANDKVYVFDLSFRDEDAMKDKNVLTLFESVKIQ